MSSTSSQVYKSAQPCYIRLPRSGNSCLHSGLSRSALDLITRPQEANDFKPPVASKILKQVGQKKGIRLINYRSLMAYLDRLPVTQDSK